MLFNRILRYLDHNQVEYRIAKPNAMADFIVETKGLTWECTITVFEAEKVLLVHSLVLDPVPPHLRNEMALHLAELNQSRVYGNFELDREEGEVRFKTYVDGNATEITPTVIERALLTNLKAMQNALPGIQAHLRRPLRMRARA